MTGAATDERRRRWSAHIDLQAGVTRLRPIDEDERPSAQTSALLDAVRRPARPEPPHFEARSEPDPEPQPEPELDEAPAQPWARQVAPAAQPQDSDRRAGTDVRVPAAAPAAPAPQSAEADSMSDEVTDRVVGRVRQILGLPPEQPPVAAPYTESPLDYAQLNPAGAFMQPPEPAEAPEPNPAGSFTAES